MRDYFKKNPKDLFFPLSIVKDTAFHIAAYSEGKELLQCLVDLVERPSSLFEALQMKNIHGNNTFHEVAITERVETAEFLVKKLQRVYGPDDGKLEELLKDTAFHIETPIYRAVALGQTKMAKFFAKKIGDSNLSYHFRRNDQVSILHIAVIGQHFGLSLSLSLSLSLIFKIYCSIDSMLYRFFQEKESNNFAYLEICRYRYMVTRKRQGTCKTFGNK